MTTAQDYADSIAQSVQRLLDSPSPAAVKALAELDKVAKEVADMVEVGEVVRCN